MPLFYDELTTKVGSVIVVVSEKGLAHVVFQAGERPLHVASDWQKNKNVTSTYVKQLDEYFCGKRKQFDLPLDPAGTPFQQQVWRALYQIPYGTTVSYKEIAQKIGKPKSMRAVGAANGRNPISVVVPCHRVIGSNGKLTGYAGGLEIKEFLIELENK